MDKKFNIRLKMLAILQAMINELPDNEKKEDDFQDFFNKFQHEGPELIKPDELQKSKIDQSSASRIKTFLLQNNPTMNDY